MMTLMLLALALAGAATPPGAPAQTPPPPPFGAGFMAADANGDGIVTREEWLADAQARFAAMDADRDGRLTASERDAYRQAQHDRRAAAADAGGPPPPHGDRGPGGWGHGGPGGPGGGGDISRADYLARAGARFDRMDANGDGRIDRAEIANLREMRRERRDGDAPPPSADRPH